MRSPLTKANETLSETLSDLRTQFSETMARLGRAIISMTVAMIAVTIVAITALVVRP
jgi:hypothetical protein